MSSASLDGVQWKILFSMWFAKGWKFLWIFKLIFWLFNFSQIFKLMCIKIYSKNICPPLDPQDFFCFIKIFSWSQTIKFHLSHMRYCQWRPWCDDNKKGDQAKISKFDLNHLRRCVFCSGKKISQKLCKQFRAIVIGHVLH
jgi:hypothetical protein